MGRVPFKLWSTVDCLTWDFDDRSRVDLRPPESDPRCAYVPDTYDGSMPQQIFTGSNMELVE
jgi:hypothetical protein